MKKFFKLLIRPRSWGPVIVENSKIPPILSKITPISINAITIFPFVFVKDEISNKTQIHETIHFQQYLETAVIGFILLYFWDYCWLRLGGTEGWLAYRLIRAEQEAHTHDCNSGYLKSRKRWKWLSK